MKIVVTSQSQHKLPVVEEWVHSFEWGKEIEVIGYKTPTTIEQPVGIPQGTDLCFERAHYLIEKDLVQETDIIISIESALDINWDKKTAEDLPFIGIMTGIGTACLIKSGVRLPIPNEYFYCVEEARDRGFDSTTFGQVLEEKTGINKTGWQKELTGVSRKEQILKSLDEIRLNVRSLVLRIGK